MSEKFHVAVGTLDYFVREYEYTDVLPDQEISDAVKEPFKEKHKRVQQRKDFILSNTKRYS